MPSTDGRIGRSMLAQAGPTQSDCHLEVSVRTEGCSARHLEVSLAARLAPGRCSSSLLSRPARRLQSGEPEPSMGEGEPEMKRGRRSCICLIASGLLACGSARQVRSGRDAAGSTRRADASPTIQRGPMTTLWENERNSIGSHIRRSPAGTGRIDVLIRTNLHVWLNRVGRLLRPSDPQNGRLGQLGADRLDADHPDRSHHFSKITGSP